MMGFIVHCKIKDGKCIAAKFERVAMANFSSYVHIDGTMFAFRNFANGDDCLDKIDTLESPIYRVIENALGSREK